MKVEDANSLLKSVIEKIEIGIEDLGHKEVCFTWHSQLLRHVVLSTALGSLSTICVQ